MSVPVGRRSESGMEFLRVARDIEINLINLRIHKPKRYTFFFDEVLKVAFNILTYAKAGNSIYPENQDEVRERIIYIKKALAECQALSSHIEILHKIFQEEAIPIGLVKILSEQINTEIRLLKGVIARDKERYSKLRA